MLAGVISFFLKNPLAIVAMLMTLALGGERVQVMLAQHGQKSAQADALSARTDLKRCQGSLSAENAAVTAQSAHSAAVLADAAKIQQATLPRAQHFAGQAQAIKSASLAPGVQCERWEEADKAFLERLK